MIEWLRRPEMKTARIRIVVLTALIAVLLFFAFQRNVLDGVSSRMTAARGLSILRNVMYLIRHDYIEERDPGRTADGAFKGLVNSLDSLSGYLDRELTSKLLERSRHRMDPGLVLNKKYGNFPLVVGVIPGSPAEKAGILPGDLLSAVNDRPTLSMSLTEIRLHLKGPDVSPVKFRTLRGTATLEPTVERAQLFEDPFDFELLDGSSAILRIRHLFPPLTEQVRTDILDDLKTLSGYLILDLRNCYEGDLRETLAFLNLFHQSDIIGWMEKKGGEKDILGSPEKSDLPGIPLAVWVNSGTMGPAEGLAAVLQESRGAKLIGTPTPGLFALTEIFPLPDESAVLLTAGIFVPLSGRPLWEQGLSPDAVCKPEKPGDDDYLEKTKPFFPGH